MRLLPLACSPEVRDPVLRFLCICLGGAFGTGARYLLGGWVERLTASALPIGTLCVNALGSFLLGLIMHVALTTDALSPTMRYTLTTGVMGGFTTYSTFNQETVESLRGGAWGLAALSVAITLVGCLVAGFLGLAAGRLLVGR